MSGATVGLTVLAVVQVGWIVLLQGVRRLYRPSRVEAGLPTTDLREEPPAVVNLVTHRWDVTPEAVPATLLDLAARRIVELTSVSPDEELVRLRPRNHTAKLVTPYEHLVLEHLRRNATKVPGGSYVVTKQAHATGPASASRRWWRRFNRAVGADARRRRLSKGRYPVAVLVVMGLAVPLFALLLVAFLTDTGLGNDAGDPAWWAMGAAVVTFALCVDALRRFDVDGQRDTHAGRDAAAHWLGVRDTYMASGVEELAPGAVQLYERHLAYAAAMGAAPVAVARLPLGAESDEHAWSDRTGRWRQVDVVYPRWRPGWGSSPKRALVAGLLWSAVLLVPVVVTARWGSDLYTAARDALATFETPDDPANPLTEDRLRWIAIVIEVVGTIVLTILAAAGLRLGVVPAVQGLLDMRPGRTVSGLVVRRRDLARTSDDRVVVEPFVAVDEGRRDQIVAYRLRPHLGLLVEQGDEVELRVTPLLGYVAKLRELHKAARRPPVEVPKPLAPPAVPPLRTRAARRSARR
jgi:hypothetical protein